MPKKASYTEDEKIRVNDNGAWKDGTVLWRQDNDGTEGYFIEIDTTGARGRFDLAHLEKNVLAD